jgi:hypothetical protein
MAAPGLTVRVLVGALCALAPVSCASGGERASVKRSTTTTTTTTSTTTITATTTTTTTPPPSAAPPGPPPFASSIANVTAADLGASWRVGCPVGPENLRMVTVSLVGFDGAAGSGRVVVHADLAEGVVEAFRRLYEARFPVRKMKPIFTQAEFEDFETLDDNSSGFSCRNAVNADAAPHWSNHAFGRAIDINPIENPYLNGGRVLPAAGAAFTDRNDVRPGMATSDGVLVAAFAAVGWEWGASFRDYQHFSTNGH